MPQIGERIPVARDTGDAKEYIVVSHDVAGNSEVIPAEAAANLSSLERYVGRARAQQLAQSGLLAMELGA